jgi:hypothetical protein
MPEAPTIDFRLSIGSPYTYLTVMRPRAVEDSFVREGVPSSLAGAEQRLRPID